MQYTLPALPYSYDALEPHIDAQTMEIHHTKHHQGYTDKMNAVLEKYPDLTDKPLEELLHALDSLQISNDDKQAFRNNAGGYLNHKLFWEVIGPEKKIDQELVKQIEETFGSAKEFKDLFTKAAASRFGSGWAWLVQTNNGALSVYSTPNQDSPYLNGDTPILGLDVWEHAYYLKYQNKRTDYIDAWWNIVTLI